MTLDALVSCGPYEGALAESIKALKYGGRKALVEPLARELAVAFVRLPERPDVLTWVPMHAKDLGWRRFDHAELLARELSGIVRVPAVPLLVKCEQRPPQVNLNPVARALNVDGCFKPESGVDIDGQSVAIVDDVCCSGATLLQAAQVLKEAGALKVYGLVAAVSPQHEEIVAAVRRRWPEFGR